MIVKVAVIGGSGQLGGHVLRRLINDRRIERVLSLDQTPPAVLSRKLDVVQEIGGAEALISLRHAGEDVRRSAQKSGVRHLLYASTALDPDADDLVVGGMRVVRFELPVLIGARIDSRAARAYARLLALGPSPPVAPIPLVWDEDAADAIVLALFKDVRGTFPLGASPSSARAKVDLGWAPKHPTAADVMKRWAESSPGRTDPRISAFFRLLDLGASSAMIAPDDPQLAGIRARVHLWLTGKGGGDYTIAVEEGRLRVSSGIPRPPTSIATLSAALWLDLLNGRAQLATAQLTGRVRLEGEPTAAFILGGIISRYQRIRVARGIPGSAARFFVRWMEGGST